MTTDDNDQQRYQAEADEEAHLYAVLNDFADLLEEYSGQFVMFKLLEVMSSRGLSLNSIN
jgi:hypothetical protein